MADTAFEKAARYFDKELVPPLRQMLIGRQLFAKTLPLPAGSYNIDYNKVTEMGAATISQSLPVGEVHRDMVKVESTNLKLNVILKGYEIARDQWEAFKSKGQNLDTEAMLSAAHVLGQAEDDLLIQGWDPDGDSTYEVEGLYVGADNDYSTTKDFGTYGNAIDAIAGGLALMDADNVQGLNFNLTLNATQFFELVASRSTNGDFEYPQALRLLNLNEGAPKGAIRVSADMTAGKGMLSPVDPSGRIMDLVIGQDPRNILGEDSKLKSISPIYGTVYEVLVPRIKQPNGLCKLSDI